MIKPFQRIIQRQDSTPSSTSRSHQCTEEQIRIQKNWNRLRKTSNSVKRKTNVRMVMNLIYSLIRWGQYSSKTQTTTITSSSSTTMTITTVIPSTSSSHTTKTTMSMIITSKNKSSNGTRKCGNSLHASSATLMIELSFSMSNNSCTKLEIQIVLIVIQSTTTDLRNTEFNNLNSIKYSQDSKLMAIILNNWGLNIMMDNNNQNTLTQHPWKQHRNQQKITKLSI